MPSPRRSRSSRACRCTGCGATSRPTPARRHAAGPPVLMVHPMMMSADMWDVTRDEGAVGILHKAGIDPWVIDFGSPDKVEGGMDRNLADHVVALSEAIDTVKEVTGRDVHLAGYSQGGMFAYQTAAYRRSKDLASIVAFGSPVDTLAGAADEPARQPRARGRRLHGRPRVQPHRHPGVVGAHRFSDARPDQDRAVPAGLPAPAARPRGAAAARTAAPVPGIRRLDRLVRARRSRNCSSSSSRTTG